MYKSKTIRRKFHLILSANLDPSNQFLQTMIANKKQKSCAKTKTHVVGQINVKYIEGKMIKLNP